jgi:catechol 2,3-dioxygenase-like lactoylglutathione lyase family enzyme
MRINHLNVVCADMQRSLDFYVGLLGLRVVFECDLHGDWIDAVTNLNGVSAHCVFVQPPGGGTRIELLEYRSPPGGPAIPEDGIANTRGLRHLAFEVDDLDGLYARLRDADVPFLSPPVSVPFMVVGNIRKRLCYLRDPDGVIVEIADYRAEE